jgi:hypothetical protein
MALPDSFKYQQGTPITWGDSGALGVTSGAWLSLNNLASATGRMGQAVDLGALFDQDYGCLVSIDAGTAPASGTSVEVYLAFSHQNSPWPAMVTGLDAAYPVNVDQNKRMLGMPISIVSAVNTGTFTFVQQPTLFTPLGRYVTPVVINLLGQAFRNTTAASHNSRVTIYPLTGTMQD